MNKDGIVEMCIKELTLLIKEMDSDICNGLTDHTIRANGRMGSKMAMENYIHTKLV